MFRPAVQSWPSVVSILADWERSYHSVLLHQPEAVTTACRPALTLPILALTLPILALTLPILALILPILALTLPILALTLPILALILPILALILPLLTLILPLLTLILPILTLILPILTLILPLLTICPRPCCAYRDGCGVEGDFAKQLLWNGASISRARVTLHHARTTERRSGAHRSPCRLKRSNIPPTFSSVGETFDRFSHGTDVMTNSVRF